MKSDYKIQGKTVKLDVTVEGHVAELLQKMVGFSKHSADEIVNTALKRFIAAHKDFLPPEAREGMTRKAS